MYSQTFCFHPQTQWCWQLPNAYRIPAQSHHFEYPTTIKRARIRTCFLLNTSNFREINIEQTYLHNFLIWHPCNKQILFIFIRIEFDTIRNLPVGESWNTLPCNRKPIYNVSGWKCYGLIGCLQILKKSTLLIADNTSFKVLERIRGQNFPCYLHKHAHTNCPVSLLQLPKQYNCSVLCMPPGRNKNIRTGSGYHDIFAKLHLLRIRGLLNKRYKLGQD